MMLILAKLREADQKRKIITNTYFHSDWRADINDWEYAEEAARTIGSDQGAITIDNATFCEAHKGLVTRAKNVFHTYAAAFYLQNDAYRCANVPIVNGSGPDELIIGTEKFHRGTFAAA